MRDLPDKVNTSQKTSTLEALRYSQQLYASGFMNIYYSKLPINVYVLT